VAAAISDPLGGSLRLAGATVEVVQAPLAIRGTAISVKRSKVPNRSLRDLVQDGVLEQGTADVLKALAAGGAGLLFTAANRSDASTLVNALLGEVGGSERIVLIESTPGIPLQSRNLIRLQHTSSTGPSPVSRAISLEPTLLVLDPLPELGVFDWLAGSPSRAFGCIATVAARNVVEGLSKLELSAAEDHAGEVRTLRKRIAALVDLAVHVDRTPDGALYVRNVVDVVAASTDGFQLVPVFKGRVSAGGVEFSTTGHVPEVYAALREADESLDGNIFSSGA
jgi:pilus assembly protein CpaF